MIPVRIFFIGCNYCSDDLAQIFLEQNNYQKFFDIGLANTWQYWQGRAESEAELKNFKTKSRLEFCEKFRDQIEKFNEDFRESDFKGLNVVITEFVFPKNFYLWNTRERDVFVIGINSINAIFNNDSQIIDKAILRIFQRGLIFALQIQDLVVHNDTRGCLFDFTISLKDLKFSLNKVRLCGECSNKIKQDKGEAYFNEIFNWINTLHDESNTTRLFNAMSAGFSMSELKVLCFGLEIDFENVPGTVKDEKIIGIINYCDRRGLLERLRKEVKNKRPNLVV